MSIGPATQPENIAVSADMVIATSITNCSAAVGMNGFVPDIVCAQQVRHIAIR